MKLSSIHENMFENVSKPYPVLNVPLKIMLKIVNHFFQRLCVRLDVSRVILAGCQAFLIIVQSLVSPVSSKEERIKIRIGRSRKNVGE